MTSPGRALPQPIQWLLTAMVVWGMNLSAVKAQTAFFGVLTLASVRPIILTATIDALPTRAGASS